MQGDTRNKVLTYLGEDKQYYVNNVEEQDNFVKLIDDKKLVFFPQENIKKVHEFMMKRSG